LCHRATLWRAAKLTVLHCCNFAFKSKRKNHAHTRRKRISNSSQQPRELLRRYWHPVAAAGEFTEEKPIRPVKILGEELVVYRDKKGNYGLVGEHCPHRSASLAYGRVDDEGIRCPYHGWKFDCTGKCLEQPAEPVDSTFKDRIKHVAY